MEVLFDAICRENGIEHLLTLPRSPTTTGKIERFHRTLRAEFDTRQVFPSLQTAQRRLDEWVGYYNTARPHQAIDDATPAERIHQQRRIARSAAVGFGGSRGAGPGGDQTRRAPRLETATAGSPAGSDPTASCASAGSRSASANTAPGNAATCWSPTSCCSSGSATNC